MQVSKCEKFGYGVMVTQIAATAPGMVALEKKGEECICFVVEFFPSSFLSAAILRFLIWFYCQALLYLTDNC